MSATDVLDALDTVEQDHTLVLRKLQILKDAVKYLLDPEECGSKEVLARLRTANDFFHNEFEAHLLEEETTLFPLLVENLRGGGELVKRLRAEHDDIRRLREEFSGCLRVATELEDDLNRTVLWDLLTYGWDLWEVLQRHAHDETEAVQKCAAGRLSIEQAART